MFEVVKGSVAMIAVDLKQSNTQFNGNSRALGGVSKAIKLYKICLNENQWTTDVISNV